jgi:hypothetical protein
VLLLILVRFQPGRHGAQKIVYHFATSLSAHVGNLFASQSESGNFLGEISSNKSLQIVVVKRFFRISISHSISFILEDI